MEETTNQSGELYYIIKRSCDLITLQRRTRERLLSVLNTCGAAMTTNPSVSRHVQLSYNIIVIMWCQVIFDDESMIQGYSSVSEGTSIRDELEVNSLRESEMMDNSQPESQVMSYL